jgi:peroxiredoxin
MSHSMKSNDKTTVGPAPLKHGAKKPEKKDGKRTMSKKNIILFTVIGIIVLGAIIWAAITFIPFPRSCPVLDNPAPDFTLKSVEGDSVSLSDFRGKNVMLYWWHSSYVSSAYDLLYMKEVYNDSLSGDVVILAINTGESASSVKSYVEVLGLPITVLVDPQSHVYNRYCVPQTIPFTLMIDREGIIKDSRIGHFNDKNEILALFDSVQGIPAADRTPPEISEIMVLDITGTSAVITWETEESATSIVDYREASSSEPARQMSDVLVTRHSITLTDLKPLTEYQFTITSVDASGNESVVEDGLVFTTLTAVPVGVAVGDMAPDFTLEQYGGGQVTLSDFRGQWILLHFWQSTCSACRNEIPYIQSYYDTWDNEKIVILTVATRDKFALVRAYMVGNGLDFPVLLDPEGTLDELYQITGFPTSYFIDPDGIIRYVKEERFMNLDEIEVAVDAIVSSSE